MLQFDRKEVARLNLAPPIRIPNHRGSADRPFRLDRWLRLLPLCPFLWLWTQLILQLRWEWMLNPQYAYGWAVPALCVGLAWRTAAHLPRSDWTALLASPTDPAQSRTPPWRSIAPAAAAAAFYLLIRFVQEANPDWRVVSWGLALLAAGCTIYALQITLGRAGARALTFPVLFFFVAVPWPTLIESPLIQFLTRVDMSLANETLLWLGLPTVQRGNTFVTGLGPVEVDEACSGIRSIQGTLMMALFLGDWFSLSRPRRFRLAITSMLLAVLLNAGRTLCLVGLASASGLDTLSRWHDVIGLSALVADILAVYALAGQLQPRSAALQSLRSLPPARRAPDSERPERSADSKPGYARAALQPFSRVLGLGLLIAELAVSAWYGLHEMQHALAEPWTLRVPGQDPSYRPVSFSKPARRMLRYDHAENFKFEAEGVTWQVTFIQWRPGRVAIYLANQHNPVNCLAALGKTLQRDIGTRSYTCQGLTLPFHAHEFAEPDGTPVFVFAGVWERRRGVLPPAGEEMTMRRRLGAVWAGRRNPGQQSLEIAVWGIEDLAQAEAALRRQLARLVAKG